jgi:hypothetical protein
MIDDDISMKSCIWLESSVLLRWANKRVSTSNAVGYEDMWQGLSRSTKTAICEGRFWRKWKNSGEY